MLTGNEICAVVTGAASGIGLATAARLAKDGYAVTLVDRDRDALDHATRSIDGSRTVCVDLAQGEQAAATVAEGLDGPVGVLVNCAGIGYAASVGETSAEQWEMTVAVNLSATFYMCRMVLPGMLDNGSGVIVNISSAGGLVGLKDRAAYCASKAGVLGLTRAIAADHAGAGIRCNAICPGTVDSPWIGKILADNPDPAGTRARMEQRQLDGRMGTPNEVANWIAFVAGDTGRFMNGAALVIDGGLTAV